MKIKVKTKYDSNPVIDFTKMIDYKNLTLERQNEIFNEFFRKVTFSKPPFIIIRD